MRPRLGTFLLALLTCGLQVGAAIADRDPPRPDIGRWRLAIDRAAGRAPGGELAWARKSVRLEARWRDGGWTATRLAGRGVSRLESWHAGQLVLRWGAGATDSPRAAPGAVYSITAGGPSALAGGSVAVRVLRGKLLIAAGSREAPGARGARRPYAMGAAVRGGAGILLGGGPGSRSLGSVYLSGGGPTSRSELEIAFAGEERGLAGRVVTGAAGLETTIGLRFRAARGEPPSGARGRGDLDLDLLVRGMARGIPLAAGARADLADPRRVDALMTGGELASATSTRQAWLDVTLPIARDRTPVLVHGEMRRVDGRDRGRLHASLRTPLARMAAEWTDGGGHGLGFRWRWDLPRRLTLEAGAAAWSGPPAATGSTIDLPRVPEHELLPRLAAPGQSAAFLMDWQVAQVRVRLGLATRRSHEAVPDIQVASRLDWAWPPVAEAP